MNLTVEKEQISTSATVVNKGRLMWIKLSDSPKSFPVEIHFQQTNLGKGSRDLVSIEVRGENISRWSSASGLWQRVASCISYEVKNLSKQELPADECKKIISEIKKQVKTDKIKISSNNDEDDLD